jgi:phosphonate transport system substrate-binding protein
MHLQRTWTLAAVLAAVAVSAAPPSAPPLRVTAIPEARDDFQKNEAVFTAWLGHETGVHVVLRLASSYEEAVQLLVSKEADLGWLGGVTTVQVMTKTAGRVHPLVIREKDREFKSYVIAASSLGAGSLKALRGKRFTFGSPLSTSGHVMPRFFLLQQGLVPEKLFGSVTYSGDHKKTVLAIASGQQDCGAVNYKVFDQMVADRQVDPAKVEVVWTSPTFVDQAWVAARDVDARLAPAMLQRIKAAFLALDASRPGDRRVLQILKTDRYVEAKAEWWRGVAAALSAVKLPASP